jgi:membrane protease YdiL (CAAX protease family)
MNFINLANLGKTTFVSYLTTFVLVIAAMLGFGLLPYTLRLNQLGLPVDGTVSPKTAMEYMGENQFLVLQLMPFIFALGMLLLCIKSVHRRPIITLFTTRKAFDWKRFFVSFSAWGILMLAMLTIGYFTSENSYTWNYNPKTFWFLVLIALFVIPLQTTFEEVFFRGFLFQATGSIFQKGLTTAIFTGILFGLVHGANPEVKTLGIGILAYYIGTGVFLGLITWKDEGLELSMGFHAVNNIFGAIIVTNSWQVFQSDALLMDHAIPSFGWDTLVSMLICFPLLYMFFAKKYGWKNRKEDSV